MGGSPWFPPCFQKLSTKILSWVFYHLNFIRFHRVCFPKSSVYMIFTCHCTDGFFFCYSKFMRKLARICLTRLYFEFIAVDNGDIFCSVFGMMGYYYYTRRLLLFHLGFGLSAILIALLGIILLIFLFHPIDQLVFFTVVAIVELHKLKNFS